jgi:alpha/beta superfamily hydrolase
VDRLFVSGDAELAGAIAAPRGHAGAKRPGLVLCHGYPSFPGGEAAMSAFPELAERIATELGWVVLTFAYRGCAPSTGDFSLDGWLDDIINAVGCLGDRDDVDGIWIVGAGTGGALGICAAAGLDTVRGVATLGAPADFADWASHPRRLLQHSRELGLISSPDFPVTADAFSRPLRELKADACASLLAPRSLLVVHGSDDELVPVFDARVLVDAHGSAELRVINGASHWLRHDPRAIAILLGWLDRQVHL